MGGLASARRGTGRGAFKNFAGGTLAGFGKQLNTEAYKIRSLSPARGAIVDAWQKDHGNDEFANLPCLVCGTTIHDTLFVVVDVEGRSGPVHNQSYPLDCLDKLEADIGREVAENEILQSTTRADAKENLDLMGTSVYHKPEQQEKFWIAKGGARKDNEGNIIEKDGKKEKYTVEEAHNAIVDLAKASVAEYRATRKNVRQTGQISVPDEIGDYVDKEALKIAYEEDNKEYIKLAYAHGFVQWQKNDVKRDDHPMSDEEASELFERVRNEIQDVE
jgi:hypothetical protein